MEDVFKTPVCIEGELPNLLRFAKKLEDVGYIRDKGNIGIIDEDTITHLLTYRNGQYGLHNHSGAFERISFTLPQDLNKALEAIKEHVK